MQRDRDLGFLGALLGLKSRFLCLARGQGSRSASCQQDGNQANNDPLNL
jgi:hypothetical protein